MTTRNPIAAQRLRTPLLRKRKCTRGQVRSKMAALRALVSGCGRQLQAFLAGPAATGWLWLPARGLREGESQDPETPRDLRAS